MNLLKSHTKKTVALIFLLLIISAYFTYFPGQQSIIAFVVGTGVSVDYLQTQIDTIEKKVLSGKRLSDDEKEFLSDMYTCFYKGARVLYIYRQTAELMEHYLSCSGEPLTINSRIFVNSSRVKKRMKLLKIRILNSIRNGEIERDFPSEPFYMGDSSFPDSFTGLYIGKLIAKVNRVDKDKLKIVWKADHPWHWPSFEHIKGKYGSLSSHRFPIPNLRSVIFGAEHSLYINDGLGEHLVKLGLAKPFDVDSSWTETLTIK